MRIVFFGTPDDAVPALRALHAAGQEIALVVTQPDRRRGRGKDLVPSPVKVAAERAGIPVRTPEHAREVRDEVAESGADVGVVVAFGQMLPESLFTAVPLGFVNVHFSLLPRWRGAAPVERAILAGDAETGVCIMAIAKGLDTGDVYARVATPIAPTETAGFLRTRLVELGKDLLLDTLPRLSTITPEPQTGEPTYAHKLTVEEFELDWSRPAGDLDRVIRAGNPRPGAWTTVEGNRLKILEASLDEHGALVPGLVQPEGRRQMTFDAWRRGRRGKPFEFGS